MAFNGSGTFVLSAGQPVVTGTVISSSTHNTLATDLTDNGLTLCITKNGQTTVTANIPFGGFRLTGIGAPTATGDALREGSAIGATTAAAVTGTTFSGQSLATTAASPLLMTNGQLVTTALTSQSVGAATLTIPDFGGVADEYTFKTKSQTMSNKTFVAPALGTPASGVATNLTGTATGLTSGKTLNVFDDPHYWMGV